MSTSRVPLMAVFAIAAVFTRERVSNVSQQDRLWIFGLSTTTGFIQYAIVLHEPLVGTLAASAMQAEKRRESATKKNIMFSGLDITSVCL